MYGHGNPLETQCIRIDMGVAVCDTRRVFHVGDVIRKLRLRQQMGVKELALKSKLNKGTVSAVERGENFKKETIEALAAGLGVSVTQLYAPLSNMEPTGTEGQYESTNDPRADLSQQHKPESRTYSEQSSGVKKTLQSAGGQPDVATSQSRVHELTTALLNAAAGFNAIISSCQEYRAAINTITGEQIALDSGVKPKPAKSNRGRSGSRTGVSRSRRRR